MWSDTKRDPEATAHQHVARLMEGYLITQLLYVAAKLGIADLLADGPRSSAALATTVGVDPDALRRVLRGLAAEGVFEELPDGQFGLTALGSCLRADVPDSQYTAIISRGNLYFEAAAHLFDAVRDGGAAFERAYGDTFFGYFSKHPDRGAAFQRAMADRSRQEAADVVASYDFSAFRRLIDVGGGSGVLLSEILTAAPHLQGVLFDTPSAVDQARAQRQTSGVAERCELVGGDFFDSVPSGGDAYLLSRVIHDWNDELALQILATCHRAMDDGATLLLVDAVLPERAAESPAVILMDLRMMMLLHGRERTETEFEHLLASAGFRMTRIVPTPSPVRLSIIEAIRTNTSDAG